jgi:parallel beta-helix repeat protein
VVEGETLYVNTTGSNGAYTSIQDAINASIDGDTVYVFNGTYYEHLAVNKSINLTGENRNNTIIDGGGEKEVVNVSADWVNITGFTVTGSGFSVPDAGILLFEVKNCKIFNDIISFNHYGIIIWYSGNNNIVGNNVSNNRMTGIHLGYSNNNLITHNDANSNIWIGIYLDRSNENNVTFNNAEKNGLYGIDISRSNENNISRNNASSNVQYGIWIPYSSSRNKIINNNASNNGMYGIYVMDSTEITIGNNTVFSNDEHGIYLRDSIDNDIINNSVCLNYDYGIYLRYSHDNNIIGNIANSNGDGILIRESHRNNIFGNDALDNRYGPFSGEGIYLSYSTGNNVTGNNFSFNEIGIAFGESDENIIINNNVSSNKYSGMSLLGSNGNSILGNTMIKNGIVIQGYHLENWNTHIITTSNTVNGKPVYYWKNQTGGIVPPDAGQVILVNCTDIIVENQELINASAGIVLGFSSNNTIVGNNASLNSYDGVSLSWSSNNNITGNIAKNNHRSGIYLYYSDVTIVVDNDVSSNSRKGIYVFSSSYNNITENFVSDNEIGISLFSKYSKFNNITYNTFLNNYYGIYLRYSSNSTIHHNDIINNMVQAYQYDTFDNFWDDGKGEGNYWDDYLGVDDGSNGRTAGDGVGDTEIPHPFFDEGNGYYQLDNYPLMNPIGNYTYLYEGWNLISIPYCLSDTTLEYVLSSINGSYDAIQWYNSTDTIDHWKHHHTLKPPNMNDLDNIFHTMGFWVHIIELGGVLFEYPGIQPTSNQNVTLNTGWNLVGYPSLTSYNRTEGLNNLTFKSQVEAIWTYNSATQRWGELGESDFFQVGRGYYIHAEIECVWEVPL